MNEQARYNRFFGTLICIGYQRAEEFKPKSAWKAQAKQIQIGRNERSAGVKNVHTCVVERRALARVCISKAKSNRHMHAYNAP